MDLFEQIQNLRTAVKALRGTPGMETTVAELEDRLFLLEDKYEDLRSDVEPAY